MCTTNTVLPFNIIKIIKFVCKLTITNMADEEDEIGPTVAYKDNPAWKDVQPIPQDDGPTPVVRIAYTEKCTVTR